MDQSKITLTNLYVDANQNLTTTDVYGNGVMQALLFPVVNYDGDASADDIDAIKSYVFDNVVINQINTDGSSTVLAWEKSKEDNGFLHDLIREVSLQSTTKQSSNIRTPMYFTVPFGSSGSYKFYAKLDGQESNKTTPVVVTATELSISSGDFEITDVAAERDVQLRVLKTKKNSTSLPIAHKLTTTDPRGIQYRYDGHNWSGAEQVMMASRKGHKAGFFLRHDELGKKHPVYTMGEGKYYTENSQPSTYVLHEITESDIGDPNISGSINFLNALNQGWGYPENFTQSALDTAFNLGLPMFMVFSDKIEMTWESTHDGQLLDLFLGGFTIHDNFGNVMKIDINWNVGDWYGIWAVSNVSIVYPL